MMAKGRRAVGIVVGMGLFLGPVSGQAKGPPPTSPSFFTSTVSFKVFVVKARGQRFEYIGQTPSPNPIQIPPCEFWFVRPFGEIDLAGR